MDYYENNKDKVLKRMKERYETEDGMKERVKQYNKDYYQHNKIKLNKKHIEYNKKYMTPEKRAKYNKTYYNRNRRNFYERNKEWRDNDIIHSSRSLDRIDHDVLLVFDN